MRKQNEFDLAGDLAKAVLMVVPIVALAVLQIIQFTLLVLWKLITLPFKLRK